ncbi:MAG: 2'-5' RNA ligase [Oleispira sp.]
MNDLFLDEEVTQPAELRDFFEWHQGIKHYGFWAIEIHNKVCLQQIQNSQQQLADTLHPHYLRQPHLTLSASGLLDEQHFTQASLQQQIKTLKESALTHFSLNLSHADSFSTAPYLSISDPSHSLEKLRTLLNTICKEQDPSEYVPHVTLGFYNKAYKTVDILPRLADIKALNTAFIVSDIVFAQYDTHEIQGPYKVLHRIVFDAFTNKTNKRND